MERSTTVAMPRPEPAESRSAAAEAPHRAPGRRFGVAAIVAIALGAATLIQALGWNQTSHYALVRGLAKGTATIDPYAGTTGDKARYHGHWYSARAPGLALATLPAFEALKLTGVNQDIHNDIEHGKKTDKMIWLLSIWAALLPAVGTMLLVRSLGDRIAPGYGTAAGVTLGIGTLFLPFSTLLLSHVFTAFLGFAAFALLWRERDRAGPDRLWVLAIAGLLVGYAIASEYPLLFAAIVLGIYAISRGEVIKRGLAYAAGVVVGVVPLAVYDKLAFGSFTHVAYADIPKQQHGFFGIQLPDPKVTAELLFSSRGLLTLAPVLIMGIAGTVMLHRRGRRAEAWVITAIALVYLAYNSGYYLPYGGAVPGPRFLITILPFLALPLALAFRRWPALTLGLAAVSATCMAIPTMVKPFISAEGDTGQWMRLFEHHDLQATIVRFTGDRGFTTMIPFVVLIAAGAVLAWAATPAARLSWRALGVAGGAAGLWALLATFVPRVLGIDHAAERKIVAAGDPTAVHEKYGSHPIAHLALAGLGAALLALAAAAVAGRLRSRQPMSAAPASAA